VCRRSHLAQALCQQIEKSIRIDLGYNPAIRRCLGPTPPIDDRPAQSRPVGDIDLYMAVTAEDIKRVANKYLVENNRTAVTALPPSS